jgi:hypothetical protein
MQVIDVEVQDIEIVCPLPHAVEHLHDVRDGIAHGRIQAQGLRHASHQLGACHGIATGE